MRFAETKTQRAC